MLTNTTVLSDYLYSVFLSSFCFLMLLLLSVFKNLTIFSLLFFVLFYFEILSFRFHSNSSSNSYLTDLFSSKYILSVFLNR